MSDEKQRKVNPILILFIIGAAAGGLMALLTIGSGQFFQQAAVDAYPTPPPDTVRPGVPAPDFVGTTPDDGEIALTDLRGSVVALNFWATWCGPCKVEMPALQAASQEHPEVVIIGVNLGESPRRVSNFMEEYALTFPAVVDQDESISNLYGVRNLPTTVWIDAEGIVQAEHFGALTDQLIDQYIANLTES